MSGGRAWMPWHIGDYLGDTTHLTTLQHGAYDLLLMTYWRTGPLADNDAILARIAKLHPNGWARIAPVIRAFFHLGDDGRLHQKRVDLEIQRVGDISTKRSTSARSKPLKSIRGVPANAGTKPLQTSVPPVVVVVPKEDTDSEVRTGETRARAAPARPSTRGTRIPDGWAPPARDRELAESLGLDGPAVAAEFVDYWRGVPGARGLKVDWPATFRNRCREIAQRGGARRELPLLRIAGGRSMALSAAEQFERDVMAEIEKEAAD